VNRPGEFPITRYVDVVQALSMAGGTTPFAQLDNIKILRRDGTTQQAIPFAYGDIAGGKRLQQNIVLQPGDTVLVP
jgi:polysaccharide export outer membrane protein